MFYSEEKIRGVPDGGGTRAGEMARGQANAANVEKATASETASETARDELDAGGGGDDEHVTPSMVIRAAPLRALGGPVTQPEAPSPETQHVKFVPCV